MSNRVEREKLEKHYGHYCFMCVLKGQGQLSKMRHLTYHHIVPANRYKKRGITGATTIGNGALLCHDCHEELEAMPEKEREKMNRKLVKYKADFDKGISIMMPKELKEEECIIIQAYDRELQDMIFEDNLMEMGLL